MHKNQDKQFLKIPKNWENISWEHRNIYVAYLWVKRYSRFGRVHRRHLPKKHFWHWISKLVSVGFMRLEGDYYVLKGYNEVWGLLGISKVKTGAGKRFRFYKGLDLQTNWSSFKKKVVSDILGFQAERKKAQVKVKLKYRGMSTDVSTQSILFGSSSAAKLFGYKSRTSGSRYREKMFDLVKEPLKLRLKHTSDGLPYFQFDCKRVLLKNMYHEG